MSQVVVGIIGGVVLVLAGCLVVLLQRLLWDRVLRLSEKVFRHGEGAVSSRVRDLAS